MFALLISMPRFKSIIFCQNSPKIKLFLQKNAKLLSAWGFAPQTSSRWRLGASPLEPQWPPATGSSAPTSPKYPPNCELLATLL